ncbi:sarcosine oxidase subunit gamma [Stutzerimonas stutzeri]|uniref:sarcosine oxidase subunit gamma n=1 Tax=Pseudomonadaceae TaxID=135621 RepID=UPI001F3974A0|nr:MULTISPECIES: sarcosine oxidase subunit gamma family protein [Pseudomonadaceae]UIP35113.1 sarcosine oxidase [Stutzerimonas kunmingensis]
MMTVTIQDCAERSPIYDLYGNAALTQLGNRPFVARYATGDESEQLRRCGLVDLSNLPRVGFRGADSAAFLQARGYQLPEKPNRGTSQPSGETVLRLSETEYFLLGSLTDGGERIATEESDWALGEQACYLLPRQDSHAWLALTGAYLPQLMAKICGVDLRAEAFPAGAVAQTSVARLSAIVVNATTPGLPVFHILCDRASAHYLWGTLLDAMDEWGGKPVGIEAVLDLVG